MTLDQVKNYAEHSGNPIIRDLCEMVLILDASNARAHECAEREKARADNAEVEIVRLNERARNYAIIHSNAEDDRLRLLAAVRLAVDEEQEMPEEGIRRILAERDAAQSIVSRLPKTEDGVPVVPGDAVYRLEDEVINPFIVEKGMFVAFHASGMFDCVMCGGGHVSYYSTREAALAAKGESK